MFVMLKHRKNMKADVIEPQDRLLTYEEASEYMRCSKVFLWRRKKEGKLKAVTAGKKVLFRRSDIDAYLNLNAKEVIHG